MSKDRSIYKLHSSKDQRYEHESWSFTRVGPRGSLLCKEETCYLKFLLCSELCSTFGVHRHPDELSSGQIGSISAVYRLKSREGRGEGESGVGARLPQTMREIIIVKPSPIQRSRSVTAGWSYTRGTNRIGLCFGNFWVSDSCWAVGGSCTANLYSRLCRFSSLLATWGVSRLYSQASVREVVAHELEARSNLFPRGRVTVVGQTTRVN